MSPWECPGNMARLPWLPSRFRKTGMVTDGSIATTDNEADLHQTHQRTWELAARELKPDKADLKSQPRHDQVRTT
ncbi:MAG: hypothetical protein ABSF61_07215 [Anaerolineales bacterium]|jgi:hypothetical protein